MKAAIFKFARNVVVALGLLGVTWGASPAQPAGAVSGQYAGLRLPCAPGVACTVNRGGAQHGTGRHAVDFGLTYQDFYAIRGGQVSFTGWKNNGGGYQVWVDHGDNYCSLYFHLAGTSTIYVSQGAYIAPGQKVAQSGNSGNTTGPHLHLVVNQKSNGQCTDAQSNEIAMIFDEKPSGELVGGDAPVSQNTLMMFADVYGSYWSRLWIERLYQDGITSGCAQNPLRYCPETNVTRAQMAIFLLRVKYGSNYTPPPATGTLFADVSTSTWAASWIEKLYRDGITSGCAQNPLRYCPDTVVTRSQMAIFLLRVKYGSSYTPPAATGTVFADVSTSTWAASWIEKLYADRITTGCASGPLRYCPDTNVTRAQMAIFLLRVKYGSTFVP